MIDRSALEDLAGRHLAAMQSPSGVSLLLHLHNGVRHTVHGFDEFLERLPYEAISHLTLTAREPEHRSTIGFHKS